MLKFLKGLLSKTETMSSIAKVVDQAVEDKDLRNTLKAKLLEFEFTGSKAQRNWRPHLMYTIMLLLVWIIMVIPILETFCGVKIPIETYLAAVPPQLWTLLTAATTIYIGARTVEQVKGK